MRSKITIHTAPNFKPCIKVVESKSHYLTSDTEEDVRDVLVRGFRELLAHTSSTIQISYQETDTYLLLPVEDEIKYFEGIIAQKYINDSDYREKLLELANLINVKFDVEVPQEFNADVLMDQCLSVINHDGHASIKQKEFVIEFFEWMKNPTINPLIIEQEEKSTSSTINHTEEQIVKLREEGVITYTNE